MQKTTFKLEERFALMQKIDVVDFFLQQDLHFAGYRGYRSCDNSLFDNNYARDLEQLAFKKQMLIAKNVSPGCPIKEFPKKIAAKIDKQEIKANTDILFIKDIPKATYKLVSPMQDPCAAIETNKPIDFPEGTLFAIVDAMSIERFIASSIIRNKYIYLQLLNNTRVCLQRLYDINAEVIVLQWVTYYLAKGSNNESTYTLYRHDIASSAEGIIDGVEDFYVNLVKGNKNQTNIIGAEIGILLRTERNLFDEQVFVWRNKQHRFHDGYLRAPVVFTVAVRNVC